MKPARAEKQTFTPYEKFVIALLSLLQFTVVLDFMILSPLAALLMPALKISPRQFGSVVSGYGFSAAISGMLIASYADRFDRKKVLLFFYSGFILGTFLCGIANSYAFLLGARIITGAFGGVVASITLAIVADLFSFELRGRVLGFVQTSFAASQVFGLPMGLWLSNHSGWHSTFLFIAGFSVVMFVLMVYKLRPVASHIKSVPVRTVHSFSKVFSDARYLHAFLMMALLSIGGFMFMPFISAFNVKNLGIKQESLPLVYLTSGICSIVAGVLSGRISDSLGKFPVF